MPTTLDISVNEQSTLLISVTLNDEEGTEVVPDSLQWSLCDADGKIINNREQEVVSSLDTTTNILLTGADLAIQDDSTSKERRWVVIEATYSSTIGSDLPVTDQAEFQVFNLKYLK